MGTMSDQRDPASVVLALHSSASSGAQWRELATRLGAGVQVVAPDLWGYGDAPAWSGEAPLGLADEAERALAALPTDHGGAIDLVGHSYGGAVALHIARNHRQLVRSLVLIEPVAFHLLDSAPASLCGIDAIAEVQTLVEAVRAALMAADHDAGMASFIDYWNGTGAWDRLRPAVRDALRTRLPKVPIDFAAAFGEPGDLGALGAVRCPTLVLRGALSPRPVRLIATMLAGALPHAELATLADAGHMLPLTHPRQCNELIAWHLGLEQGRRPVRAA